MAKYIIESPKVSCSHANLFHSCYITHKPIMKFGSRACFLFLFHLKIKTNSRNLYSPE